MQPGARMECSARRAIALAALMTAVAGAAQAQTTGISGSAGGVVPSASGNAARVAPPPSAPNAAESARYVESCQQGIERGVVNPGCQGPIYANEIARLKEDALRTNSPNLLTLVGDAYQSTRGGLSDIAQAYRWYLLAAVRGDPRAMQRLSELYKDGRGTPRDNVKALGYARLSQRLASPGSIDARSATDTISILGSELAAEEVALAERFADELERDIQGRVGISTPIPAPRTEPTSAAGPKSLSGLPGLGSARTGSSVIDIPPAASSLPGVQRAPRVQSQP